MTLLLPLLDVEVKVPELNGSVVEAAEEVGLVEPEAEDETFAAIAAQSRLLVAPHLTSDQKVIRISSLEVLKGPVIPSVF